MKASIRGKAALAAAGAAVALALAAQGARAQTDDAAPKTRAEVKAELRQVEAAGYRPSQDRATYPAQIQGAEARASAQNGSAGPPAGQNQAPSR